MADGPLDVSRSLWELALKAFWYAARGEWPRGVFAGAPDQVPPPTGYEDWAAYFQAIGADPMTDYLPLGNPAPEGARCSLVWSRTNQDVATCGLSFVHRTEGTDTGPFTDADAATIEGLIDTFWDALKEQYHPSFALDRYDWHYFGIDVRSPNPAFRSTLKTPPVAGSADEQHLAPAQVAAGVTLKTDRRRSWGRIYMPGPVAGDNTDGLIAAAFVTMLSDAIGDLADGAEAADLPLVVWCPRHDGELLKYGEAAHAADLDVPDSSSVARGVWQTQVDDLWDIQRRRRWDRATTFERHTVG